LGYMGFLAVMLGMDCRETSPAWPLVSLSVCPVAGVMRGGFEGEVVARPEQLLGEGRGPGNT
jgi:hypothetical protein